MSVISPIHIEAIGVGNVRFFAPPLGGREFPRPSIDDLFAAMALGRKRSEHFRRSMQDGEWATNSKTIATADGITVIAQHFIAQGLIDAMTQVGRCPPDLYWTYAKGGGVALDKLTDGWSKDAIMAYLRDALAIGGGAA